MTDDELDRRIKAKCQHLLEQGWADLRERDWPRVARIALTGPEPDDHEFVQRVFVLMCNEISERMESTP